MAASAALGHRIHDARLGEHVHHLAMDGPLGKSRQQRIDQPVVAHRRDHGPLHHAVDQQLASDPGHLLFVERLRPGSRWRPPRRRPKVPTPRHPHWRQRRPDRAGRRPDRCQLPTASRMRLASVRSRSNSRASCASRAWRSRSNKVRNWSSAANRFSRLASMICRHSAGSPAAMRVESCHPPAVSVTYRSGVEPAMAAATRWGRWLVMRQRRVVLGGRQLDDRGSQIAPEFRQPRDVFAAGAGGRRQHDHAAGEQLGRGGLRAVLFVARQRMATDKVHAGRPFGPGGGLVDRPDDRPLGAAGVRDQCAGLTERGQPANLLDDMIDRRTHHDQFRRGRLRRIGRDLGNRAQVQGRLERRRPGAETEHPLGQAARRKASPTDPPISPTPTMVTERTVLMESRAL